MKWLRLLLFPFAILYGGITAIRNLLYDKNILKSFSFNLPVIVVGNLSTGGTGKSPQTEYLIRLLSVKYRVAVLSRGYKRQSKGFVLADKNTRVEDLGDEPFQFFTKFKNIYVAVDSDRKNGIQNLLELQNPPEVILLDDAFQHRKVKAGFNILLTTYGDIYTDDFMLPTGNLREWRSGAKRADIIIVTKCLPDISEEKQNIIVNKINPKHRQKVFFSKIGYDSKVYSRNQNVKFADIYKKPKLLVAGIAKPRPFFAYLQQADDDVMIFPDHHNYTNTDVLEILEKANGRIIITTEKDYMRLQNKLDSEKLFYLPIQTEFLKEVEIFNQKILDYVGESSENSSMAERKNKL
ncbi:MAG: tetraacyldisaccharide 4'-kinase [Flavobacteriaceae bacterium]|jgi:tetraacyldisaccharide 4'-kinase|nr:tetraacyldisaccharide 4'-kinase [Flavobacteriaceae bacterium]